MPASTTAGAENSGRALLPRWVGYIAALIIQVILTAALRALHPYLPLDEYPAPYAATVMFIAYFFGEGPAVFATMLSFVAYFHYFIPPAGTLALPVDLDGWAKVAAYFTITGTVIFAVAVLRRSSQQLARLATELREESENLEMAQRAAGAGVWNWDTTSGRMEWSAQMFELFGLDPSETVPSFAVWDSVLHAEDRANAHQQTDLALRDHAQLATEYRVVLPDGTTRWIAALGQGTYDAEGEPVRMSGICLDVTRRKRDEENLRRLNRTLKALSNSNQALMRATDELRFMQEVCWIIQDDCGYSLVWIGLAEDDEAKTVRPVASAGFEEGYLRALNVTWGDTERGRGPTGTAIRTVKPAVCENMQTDPLFAPWREEALERGYMSSLALPLMADGKAFGAVTIYSPEPDAFSDDEVVLLSELADDLAYGIAALRLRAEHAQAEDALRNSEADTRAILDAVQESIWMFDQAGVAVLCNSPAAARFGSTPRELIGKTLWELVGPELARSRWEIVSRVLDTGQSRQWEDRRGDMDFAHSAYPVTDEHGQVSRVVIFSHDVTERKRAEHRERELEAHKRDFYRRTILAATEGKLQITEREKIEELADVLLGSWKIDMLGSISAMRREVVSIARREGMDEERVADLTGCVVESAANALKHAGGGEAALYRNANGLFFVSSDSGPGIGALTLPDIALTKGYSTAGTLGMGYKVMIHFADKVYLSTGPDGTTVATAVGLHKDTMVPDGRLVGHSVLTS